MPVELLPPEEQPPVVEFFLQDDIFVKQMVVAKKGTYIAQHAHEYSHIYMLALGSCRVWCGDEPPKDFCAPCGIPIPAKTKHWFLALTDGMIGYCIHNASRTGEVQVYEKHDMKELPV